MTEHQSGREKAEGSKTAKLTERERLEQDTQVSAPGMVQALDGLSMAERSALVGSPNLQAAQRSQIALALQQRHGNRYVQRVLAGRLSDRSEGAKQGAGTTVHGVAGRRAIAIEPRADATDTIARWPPDSDEERLRLLTQASENLSTNIELPLSYASATLSEEDPPFWGTYGMLEEILDTVDASDFDLPDFAVVMIGQSLSYILQAASALEALDSEGANVHVRGLVNFAWSRRRSVPGGIPRGRWQRQVVAPLGRARQLTRGERPNFAQAVRLVNRAELNAMRMAASGREEAEVLRDHVARISNAGAALRVLTTERGNRRRYINGLLASAAQPLGVARGEIQAELGALGEGEPAPGVEEGAGAEATGAAGGGVGVGETGEGSVMDFSGEEPEEMGEEVVYQDAPPLVLNAPEGESSGESGEGSVMDFSGEEPEEMGEEVVYQDAPPLVLNAPEGESSGESGEGSVMDFSGEEPEEEGSVMDFSQ